MPRLICAFVVRIWHKTHFLMARLICFAFIQKFIYTWIRRATDMQQFIWFSLKNEPHHDKIWFCHMWSIKARISLRTRAVWSAPLLITAWIVSIFEILSLFPASLAAQAGLCLTWSQAPKTGFLLTRLEYDLFYFYAVLLMSLSAALRYRFRRSFNPNNHNIDNKQKLCQGQYLIIVKPLSINILCLKTSQRRENFPQ